MLQWILLLLVVNVAVEIVQKVSFFIQNVIFYSDYVNTEDVIAEHRNLE